MIPKTAMWLWKEGARKAFDVACWLLAEGGGEAAVMVFVVLVLCGGDCLPVAMAGLP